MVNFMKMTQGNFEKSRRVKKLKERTMKLLGKCSKLKLGRWQSN